MSDTHSVSLNEGEPLPLHELISRILAPEIGPSRSKKWWSGLGTMQPLNQRLANQPLLNFINATLRGVGQVIFVNNPVSGLLILIAMLIYSGWLGIMSLVGTAAATLSAIVLKLNRDEIQNGIFGLNGLLTGATIATLGMSGNGAWNLTWACAVIVFSALSAAIMGTAGVWFASKFRVAPLGIPFHVAVLSFVVIILFLPQPFFDLGSPPAALPRASSLDGWRLAQSLPISMGQVFFSDQLVVGIFVFLAIAICTPIGAVVGLLGCVMYLLAGLLFRTAPDDLYTGLWGYNAVLTAIAIGGVFYTPKRMSISIGVGCAFLASIVSWLLAALFAPLQLPVMALPSAIVTIGCFLIVRRSLPSLVPVALHAVASPEEHWQRYAISRDIITNFRRNLEAAIQGKHRCVLFDQASLAVKGDLRYIFDAIDRDRSGKLSTPELAAHLYQAGTVTSEDDLQYLFKCMDADGNGAIDFEEFGELMLRHRRLMSRYDEFVTYFIPIDADEDDVISIDEMNVAMASVRETPLSKNEVAFLQNQTGGESLTWNRFIEVLLIT